MAPRSLPSTLIFLATTCIYLVPAVHSLTNYANVFISPDYILNTPYNSSTGYAQQTIVSWADQYAQDGPWSVTNKTILPASGDAHDYFSFSPYKWPDCSNVGNTTQLTPEQIATTCPYVTRDGQFNPDARQVNNIGDFDEFANAVLYNALAWKISGDSKYSANLARFVNVWFINPATKMNPNLNFAQINRGPNGQNGTHTGILDLKCMTKIATGILALRQGQSSDWTSDLDSQMIAWTREYTSWLQNTPIAIEESQATNNHGTFYVNQLAALQLLVGDKTSAKNSVQNYFNTLYKDQISSNGDQPLESNRTRPYHYRAYNIAAMMTNARIGEYVGFSGWDAKTNDGSNIKAAVDFAMTQQPGSEDPTELYPLIDTAGAQYGDADHKYANFLAQKLSKDFLAAPYYFWDPLYSPLLASVPPAVSSSSASQASKTHSSTGAGPTGGSNSNGDSSGAFAAKLSMTSFGFVVYGLIAVALFT